MRVLVTGFAGLIGSEITKLLLDTGHTVLGNDDLSHNCADPRELLHAGQCFLCRVEQLQHFSHALGKLDLIIHCASPIGHARLTPEAEIAWTIVRDTQAILELAMMKGARLISFSSSEVLAYRGETDIRSQYALGKLAGEAMVLGHPSVDSRVIRPYNVTGRLQRADGGFVMPRFRDAVLNREPLMIFGSGQQVRHFTHVSDFALLVALLALKWPEKKRWSAFVPENRIAIIDLARQFTAGTDLLVRPFSDGSEVLGNPHWRDSAERELDLAEYEACRALGWQPKMDVEAIIAEHMGQRTEARSV
jgi:nucleoside-diphosphate-sugar epimerase